MHIKTVRIQGESEAMIKGTSFVHVAIQKYKTFQHGKQGYTEIYDTNLRNSERPGEGG